MATSRAATRKTTSVKSTATRTTRKTTSARSAKTVKTAKSASAKAEPAPAPEQPSVTAPTPMPQVVKAAASEPAPDLRKKELIDRVVATSGVKKRDAKPAAEATLAVLGEMLAEGRELNLPGLGKVRINRVEEKDGARVIVCRVRQTAGGTTDRSDAPEFQAG
ncbi:HU family DNA-binding protein [Jhaorihella thermophila]|uniref:DNA-binding protein HU-alpha n=1 Tax=Jhaorihella thermophila TaxID=488547 RepID=A0A1H5W5Y2_9RHOB|nr:HU family DNA-binding protein [Jhaorihella thermophila]SEF94636.1 DNA-binding protein HU-alpha [Jhaorihella thermophila]